MSKAASPKAQSPDAPSGADPKERLERFRAGLEKRNPGESEFHQAVLEVAESILPFIADKPRYHEERILERLTEPDRIVIFRVCWEDDEGNVRVNRGYRVQNNNAIGPYKGGIRFHPSVTLSVLKFLAFEQTFKNSLTGLPMGGAKGGADFDPKGRSDREIMRFCQSFMTSLFHHIGPDTDVPAGDIGVGPREIGYMFGQYKRLTHEFEGVLTGKGLEYGGSLIRPEATGYGTAYMMENMLERRKEGFDGRTCVVSGAGNVALYCVEKINQLGGRVVTLSDSDGFVHDPDGIDDEKLGWVMELKKDRRGRISEYAEEFTGATFHDGKKPWGVPCDLAFPCATENEIDEKAARALLDNGCTGVSEGANMPTVKAGIDAFLDARILYAPSKAANAGGVAVSGLEMSQNSTRTSWSEEVLQDRLRHIMQTIHDKCVEYGEVENGFVNYLAGANIGGFVKVADAMLSYGVV